MDQHTLLVCVVCVVVPERVCMHIFTSESIKIIDLWDHLQNSLSCYDRTGAYRTTEVGVDVRRVRVGKSFSHPFDFLSCALSDSTAVHTRAGTSSIQPAPLHNHHPHQNHACHMRCRSVGADDVLAVERGRRAPLSARVRHGRDHPTHPGSLNGAMSTTPADPPFPPSFPPPLPPSFRPPSPSHLSVR